MSSLPKTVTRQRRDRDMNPGPSAPESGTLTTRLPSHPRIKAALSTARAARARAPRVCRAALTRFTVAPSLTTSGPPASVSVTVSVIVPSRRGVRDEFDAWRSSSLDDCPSDR